MSHFESILFSYYNQDRLEYQLYAECLRLMGIYVCEKVIEIEENGIYEDKWQEKDFSICYTIEKSVDNDFSDTKMTDSSLLKKKLSLLEEHLLQMIADEDFFACFDGICDIFVQYGLLQAGTVLQYFQMNAQEVLDAGGQFEKAADQLTDMLLQEKWKNNRYMNYAGLYCKQKANLSRFLCDEPIVYYVDKLAARGLNLVMTFPDFSNAWALLGLICERKKSYIRETIDAYQRAIDVIADKPYASSIYYWMGKCFEGEPKMINTYAKKMYHRAYHSLKKYRNIYKLAVSYMNESEYQKANEFFLECIQYLKYRGDFLDPLEQEYYFKVNVHISYCYLQQMDFYNALIYAETVIKFRNELEEDRDSTAIAFYKRLYGKDAKKYKDLAVRGMGVRQAYQYRQIAERELGRIEASEKLMYKKQGCVL